MTETLLKTFGWRISQSHGCCGLYELYRLKATYETEAERSARHDAFITCGVVQGGPVKRACKLHEQVEQFTKAGMGWSIPVEWGFAAILDKLRGVGRGLEDRSGGPNIVMLSDNMEDEGDVHIGPFGTKHFVAWIKDMDIGPVHETPMRKSHKASARNLQVWIWHPDYDKIKTVCAQAYELTTAYLKEIANVEETIKAQKVEQNDRYRELFNNADGWE